MNVDPASGVAVSVTGVPSLKLDPHVEPQSIPVGELVTVPVPVPAFVTVSVLAPAVTVIEAVAPVGTTVNPAAVPPALLRYSPGVEATVTLKWIEASPEAGTEIGPDQLRSWLEMDGFAVVAPVVEPGV